MENVSDAIIVTDRDLVIASWNRGATELFGHSPEEAIGRHLRDVIAFELTPAELDAAISRVPAGQGFRRLALRETKDGARIPVRGTFVQLPGDWTYPPGYLVTYYRLPIFAAEATELALIVDSLGKSVYVSPDVARLFGRSTIEDATVDLVASAHADDAAKVRALLAEATSHPTHSFVEKFRIVRSDGYVRWVRAAVTGYLVDSIGAGVALNLQDITEQQVARDIFARQGEVARMIMDHIPAMVALTDLTGKFVYWNSEAERRLGWSSAEVRDDPETIGAKILSADNAEEARAFVLRADGTWREFPTTTRSGDRITVIWTNIRVGEHILGLGIDITERERQREERQKTREDIEHRVERRLPTGAPYGLTFRELTVLALVVNGKTDREIASALSIGYRTVQTHISNILTKMGAKVRTEAGVRAVRERIIE